LFFFVGHLWHAGRARAAAAGFEKEIIMLEPVLHMTPLYFGKQDVIQVLSLKNYPYTLNTVIVVVDQSTSAAFKFA
jgi:hypothetical protein